MDFLRESSRNLVRRNKLSLAFTFQPSCARYRIPSYPFVITSFQTISIIINLLFHKVSEVCFEFLFILISCPSVSKFSQVGPRTRPLSGNESRVSISSCKGTRSVLDVEDELAVRRSILCRFNEGACWTCWQCQHSLVSDRYNDLVKLEQKALSLSRVRPQSSTNTCSTKSFWNQIYILVRYLLRKTLVRGLNFLFAYSLNPLGSFLTSSPFVYFPAVYLRLRYPRGFRWLRLSGFFESVHKY